MTSRQLYIRAHSAPCEPHCPKPPAIPPISYFILRTNTRCSGRYLAGTWSLATPYRDRDTALNHRLAVVTIPGGWFSRTVAASSATSNRVDGKPARRETCRAFYRSHTIAIDAAFPRGLSLRLAIYARTYVRSVVKSVSRKY